ncbi:hypothetical protein QA601_18330 [Chitinispirillales bacterium ANBcel5]|uniref:hypothetical protein n=1 Tax=Cellulosispirillum alkaliphilum TaxID=3039283 RepID=UPI002A590174|nr:hypothetical protein [Chitinispirillales bacterium ANBcel5]
MNCDRDFTIFLGQSTWQPPQEPGNYDVLFISQPQEVQITQYDETDSSTPFTVYCRECEEMRPIFDAENDIVVDSIRLKQYESANFSIIRPLQYDTVYLDLHWEQNRLPVMLPRDFFSPHEPIEILFGNRVFPQIGGTPGIEVDPFDEVEPEDLENSMAMTEVPASIIEEEGLSEGAYTLESIYDKEAFIRSLCNNLLGGGIGGAVNNFDLLRDFFPGQEFYIKPYNGKYFVIFKGLSGTRATFRGTRYALQNPRVMALSAVQSPTAGATAAARGLSPALRGNVLTVVVIGVVDLVAWHQGMLSDDGRFISDLIVEFGMNVSKAAISAVVAGFVVGFGCMLLGVTAAPVFAIVAAGLVITVVVGITLDYLDETLGVSSALRNQGRKAERALTRFINERFVEPIGRNYYQLERHIRMIYMQYYNFPFRR